MEEKIIEMQLGPTRIRISDKYCKNVTPEEIEKVLKDIVFMSIGYIKQNTA